MGIHLWIALTPQLQSHIKYGLPGVEPARVVCSVLASGFSWNFSSPLHSSGKMCPAVRKVYLGKMESIFLSDFLEGKLEQGSYLGQSGAFGGVWVAALIRGGRRWRCHNPSRAQTSHNIFASAIRTAKWVSVLFSRQVFVSMASRFSSTCSIINRQF